MAARHINELERENALYGYYAAHLWDVLQTMQKVIKGDLDVTIDQFVEQGVLGHRDCPALGSPRSPSCGRGRGGRG